MANDAVYLGDGLYARFTGYSIELRAPREDGDHWIALEPDVFEALLQFALQCGFIVHATEDETT